jgi:hypothetical protein
MKPRFLLDKECFGCGSPVIELCCNGLMLQVPAAKGWDWFVYCSNKGCTNHAGEGVFQDYPNWVLRSSSAS